jgi:hypothetical protein
VFENISDFLSSGWGSVKESASGISDTWNETVADLKEKAAEFMALFTRLKAIQSNPNLSPVERSRVDAIVRRGEVVKTTVATLAKSIDGIANVLPRNLLSGVVKSGGLGILPLIPIAAIAAAIAVMTAWISDAVVELERLELAEKVRSDGGDPAAVMNAGSKINWFVLGGAGLAVAGLVYLLAKNGGLSGGRK